MQNLSKSAIDQITSLKNNEISAVELLEETISHAEKVDQYLNPFALKLYERGRHSAKKADKLLKKGQGGVLCGLPVTIKDSQFLAGFPCSNGSKTLRHFVPEKTCKAVELLEQAGAVIFAKTACPEFSLTGITNSELYGLTTNPWNQQRTCGGSSGGAAAAVAAGLGALSLGGDGGGSIRIPAGFCGIVGFKPSFGLIPREPCFPSWHSIVSYGPMARNVADTRLMYSVLNPQAANFNPADIADLTNYPLILSENLGFAPLDDDVRASFQRVREQLGLAGARILDDSPGLPSSVITWAVTATFDAYEHAKDKVYDPDHLSEVATSFLNFGAQFSQQDFDEAHSYRNVIRSAYQNLFERNASGILITPTLGCEAFPHGSIHPMQVGDTAIEQPWMDWAGLLYDANLAGLPACAIPMGMGDEGLPLSLQITGPIGSDEEVLRVAAAIELLLAWPQTIPLPSALHQPLPSDSNQPMPKTA